MTSRELARGIKSETSSQVSIVVSAGGHSETVLHWRHEEFLRMGFADYVAAMLAGTRIDLHQMENLLTSGCERDVAMQILMGTMWSGDDPKWQYKEDNLEELFEQSPDSLQ